ncbi:MAG: M1 family metallopeptidase [Saprospiraceae bacterium]
MKYFYLSFLCCMLLNCKQNISAVKKLDVERPDPHSFSQPQLARTTHLELDIECDFEQKKIKGIATYDIEQKEAIEIILDDLGLNIQEVKLIDDHNNESNTEIRMDAPDSTLGTAVHIALQKNTKKIKIKYESGPDATALQWLNPLQTNSKRYPYLFTQSQSIFARSWIPCQDGPGIRFTYHAKVKVPVGMMAAMSATNPQEKSANGQYEFNMEIPIPAYLMALAVGDFYFKPIGLRTGVYADSSVLDKAVWEFADLEKMVVAAEQLYGPYPWTRYDVIVLPSSFPFGGMENPRLTFLTPTVITSDRSLTSLLAHELAHSWSGNLVTNSTWEDFWLNEGFTTYFENRIMESLYGKSYADMLSLLGFQDLQKAIIELGDTSELTKLKLNLKDKDPEEALTDIAYEKGKMLLRYLEERIGRNEWDGFLKSYFNHFKFQSNTSEGFLKYLYTYFPKLEKGIQDTTNHWVYDPGLIGYSPHFENSRFINVEKQVNLFAISPSKYKLESGKWSTHEWIHFFRHLPKDSSGQIRNNLEMQYHFSLTGNSELAFCWINYLIENGIKDQEMEQVEKFLLSVGRRKYVLPIYENLSKNGRLKDSKAFFEKAKEGYHPITKNSIQNLLYPKI